MPPSLIDTDTLSEIIKGHDATVARRASEYLAVYGHFTFSIITRYEILRQVIKMMGDLDLIRVMSPITFITSMEQYK